MLLNQLHFFHTVFVENSTGWHPTQPFVYMLAINEMTKKYFLLFAKVKGGRVSFNGNEIEIDKCFKRASSELLFRVLLSKCHILNLMECRERFVNDANDCGFEPTDTPKTDRLLRFLRSLVIISFVLLRLFSQLPSDQMAGMVVPVTTNYLKLSLCAKHLLSKIYFKWEDYLVAWSKALYQNQFEILCRFYLLEGV